jgi:ATP-binding cassette subfamily F protein uup
MIADYVPTREGRISASQMLERFLFTPDMQYSPIGKLSGGEKKRLYLLSILIFAPNCLILDEITNDIDIPTLTILEDYLDSFLGIIILVSHDRYFLDNVVDRIFAFEGNGQIRQYEGGYTDYLEARRRMGFSDTGENNSFSGKGKKSAEKSSDKKEKASAKEWKKNSPTKLKFSFKEQKEYETIDEDIAALEEKIEQLDQEMATYASQYTKLSELTKEKEEAEQALEEKMDRWVYLNDLAERIEAQK